MIKGLLLLKEGEGGNGQGRGERDRRGMEGREDQRQGEGDLAPSSQGG